MKKDGSRFKIFSKENDSINGLFDKGCNFEGKLTFDGVVQINGDFHGEILSDGTLIVGPDARLCANILVDHLIIDGRVEGTIEAKGKIEIHSTAQVTGDVTTPALIVEEGGVLQGNCRMQKIEHRLQEKDMKRTGEEFFVQPTNDSMVM